MAESRAELAESSYESQSNDLPEEYQVIQSKIPELVKKILPDDICDELFSNGLISQSVYESMYNRKVLREDRAREMTLAVLGNVKTDKSKFEIFCSVLEKSKKSSISKLGKDIRGELTSKIYFHFYGFASHTSGSPINAGLSFHAYA